MSNPEADKPADVPFDRPARGATDPRGAPLTTARRAHYFPAIDSQGSADCQQGQTGYVEGPLATGNRYGPREDGGQHVILDSDLPGNRGPTFHGVPHLEDVP